MKPRAVHARRPWMWNGKKAGEIAGVPLCGANSRRTDSASYVTCGRCLRMLRPRPAEQRNEE
jgi:hypothetical protein